MSELYQFLEKGGVLMTPILFCSVTALALFLERLWALQQTRVLPPRLMQVVRQLLREGKGSEIETVCASSGSSVAQVVLAGASQMGRARSIVREAMESAGRREIALLNRFVGGLGTIAAISPLLGLLGTVAGMIRVFKQVVDEVSARGQVNPGSLANGIWEALITTAAGLSVAIPVYIAFRYLESRIDRVAIDMEAYSASLVDGFSAPDTTEASDTDDASARPTRSARAASVPDAGEGGGDDVEAEPEPAAEAAS